MPAKKTAPAKTTAKATAPKKTTKAERETAPPARAKSTSPERVSSAKAERSGKKAAPAKKTVARPVTRVVQREGAAPRAPLAPREKRAKVEARPLPTAPQGHAPLIAADGTSTGSVELPKALVTSAKKFATLFQAFIAARANARQATTATKNRSRVAGGGAKPWRQKGTGRARQGTIRAPHWRHGGVVFGPNGRQYDQRIPEKMRRAAFAEAVASRAAEGRVLVVEDLKLEGERPRTRDVVAWLGKIGDTGNAVMVWNEIDEPKARAMANLRELELRTPGSLRLSDVLVSDTLLVHRAALPALAARAEVGGAKAVHA